MVNGFLSHIYVALLENITKDIFKRVKVILRIGIVRVADHKFLQSNSPPQYRAINRVQIGTKKRNIFMIDLYHKNTTVPD